MFRRTFFFLAAYSHSTKSVVQYLKEHFQKSNPVCPAYWTVFAIKSERKIIEK